MNISPVSKVRLLALRCIYKININEMFMKIDIQNKNSLYTPLNKLYVDSIIKKKWNEFRFINIMLHQDKIKTSSNQYAKAFQYSLQNIQNIQRFTTIAIVLVTAYQLDYKNDELFLKFSKKAFNILKNNQNKTTNTSNNMLNIIRFVISISKLVGLDKFSTEDYQNLPYKAMKPLFIVFILQVFWRTGNSNHDFVKLLMKELRKKSHVISKSDIHHFIKAKKHIQDAQFFEIIEQARKSSQNQTEGSLNLNQKVIQKLFTEYKKDLQLKYM